MSGFVVGFGEPKRQDVETMFVKIGHRGPDFSGIHENQKVVMAQNYLKADTAGATKAVELPVGDEDGGKLRICYDGQMGNWSELAAENGVPDGPFVEERLLLKLYKQHGSKMVEHLNDAIFAFVISDGENIFAARDLLGIKTLFYGWVGNTLHLASELKAIAAVTGDVHEFPAGHMMDGPGLMSCFAELPEKAPEPQMSDVEEMVRSVREVIEKSVRSRVDFSLPTGALLSGGMDSSVIAYLSSKICREKFGPDAKLQTFALGVGEESSDIQSARIVAEQIQSEHHEYIVGLEEVLEALPDVVYYLENFDPSLVRSAVSNYLISRHAKEHGVQVLLSGEGGDEIFCGYMYLKGCGPEELFARQMECMKFLHNNAALRLDRMNQCNSVRVVAPLISGELFWLAASIPSEYKQRPDGDQKIEKYIFRRAFEGELPDAITWRLKQEFSQGSGSALLLPSHFDKVIGDEELKEAQAEYPMVRSKEELYYFRIFTEHFPSRQAINTVGQWITL